MGSIKRAITPTVALGLAASGVLGLAADCGSPRAGGDAAIALDASDLLDAPAVDASPFDAPPGVPDLQVVGERTAATWLVDSVPFDAGACEVVEGCVDSVGLRRLLRFATVTANRGSGDLLVGVPPDAGISNTTFQWSECHRHHHVVNYTSYELVNGAGTVVTGRKQSFCLQDDEPLQVGGQRARYSCKNQGIQRGWADVYIRETACQWIDVTDVPPGPYTLRITVNPLNTIIESNYDNNVFTLDVNL
jgi:hypothetical protein